MPAANHSSRLRMTPPPSGLAACLILLALWLRPEPAFGQTAPTVDACTRAYVAGQEARLRGDRLEAVELFTACAHPSCPTVVVKDCEPWLEEVQAELASVLLVVMDPTGSSMMGVTLYIDGKHVDWSDSEAIVVTPGTHRFRLEAVGYEPVSTERTFDVGERDAVLEVTLEPSAPKQTQTAPPPEPPDAPEPAPDDARGVPTASIVMASVGVISLGIGAGFGLSAGHDYNELERECAPGCPTNRADAVARKAFIADVALATGVVALAGAAWFYSANEPSHTVAFSIEPNTTGAAARLRASF